MSGQGCPDCGRTTVEDEPCVWCAAPELVRNPTIPRSVRLAVERPTQPTPETTVPSASIPEGLREARRVLAAVVAAKKAKP